MLAEKVSNGVMQSDLTMFANTYLNVFNEGFHYAFAASIVALLISLTIYLKNRASLPDPAAKKMADGNKEEIAMDQKEIKQRIYALAAVMGVVIFF
jgi:POT family proton-dependent oligopeptide transporter